MKAFGKSDPQHANGVTLPYLIGWLESLCASEEETISSHRGPRARRLSKAQDALALLNEVSNMSLEDQK